MYIKPTGYVINLKSFLQYRRATCQLQTLKPQAAIADFKRVLAIEPKNDTVRQQLTATQKLIRKIEFEKVCLYVRYFCISLKCCRLLKSKARRTP